MSGKSVEELRAECAAFIATGASASRKPTRPPVSECCVCECSVCVTVSYVVHTPGRVLWTLLMPRLACNLLPLCCVIVGTSERWRISFRRVIENVGGRRAVAFWTLVAFLGCRTVFASCHVGVLVVPCFPIAGTDLGDSFVSAHGVG
jgi:hypothetical protein